MRVDRGLVDIIKDNWINKTPLLLQHPIQRERLIPLACTRAHTHTCFHILWNNHTHAYTHFRLLAVCVRNRRRHTPPLLLLLMCLWTAERSVILWKHTYTHLYIYMLAHMSLSVIARRFLSPVLPPHPHPTHTGRNFEDKKADKSLRAVSVCACVCVCVCACSRCLGHSGQSPSLASQRGNSRAFSPDSLQRRGRFISICIFVCVIFRCFILFIYFFQSRGFNLYILICLNLSGLFIFLFFFIRGVFFLHFILEALFDFLYSNSVLF